MYTCFTILEHVDELTVILDDGVEAGAVPCFGMAHVVEAAGLVGCDNGV